MTAEAPAAPAPRRRGAGRSLLLKAPSVPLSLLYLGLLSAGLSALYVEPATAARWAAVFLAAFLGPTIAAAILTAPLAEALGGRLALRRSALLALSGLVVEAPLLAIGVAFDRVLPGYSVPIVLVFLLAQGPVLWFRHLSLFGVSNPSHGRTLPASLLQPLLSVVGIAVVVPLSGADLVAAVLFLLFGFATSVQLLRAADRPLRREFQTSGVSLIRPMLDHINERDPEATERLESFFSRFAILADLSVSLLEFRARGRAKATIVLPTVHPGPFAALGASDLPRKVADRLGSEAGLVLVPHTPCNHELDIPNGRAVARLLDATAELRGHLAAAPARSGPSVLPSPGSLARAQCLGDAVLLVVSQAPEPTDDIAFAVGDALRKRDAERREGPLLLVDAHNSYTEDQGDIAYGTTVAARLQRDAEAAIAAARAAARDGPPSVGVSARLDYTVRDDGIGPAGIRCFAVRAGGRTAAYLLIDGNNLLRGIRAKVLDALRPLVDDAEVLTTDNHIVHEVDGSINPVGERMPAERLAADCRSLVEAALRDLEPVEVRTGMTEVREVPVLGPSWTERLLTSLGDTVSVFGHQAAVTLLLLLAASSVVLAALR